MNCTLCVISKKLKTAGDFPLNTLGKGEKFNILNINIVWRFSKMMSIGDLIKVGLSKREDIHTALPQFGWNVNAAVAMHGLYSVHNI